MPQLMPLLWSVSGFLIVFIIFVMSVIYGLVSDMKMNLRGANNLKVKSVWWW